MLCAWIGSAVVGVVWLLVCMAFVVCVRAVCISIHYNLHLENTIIHPSLDFPYHICCFSTAHNWMAILVPPKKHNERNGRRRLSVLCTVVSGRWCACAHYNHNHSQHSFSQSVQSRQYFGGGVVVVVWFSFCYFEKVKRTEGAIYIIWNNRNTTITW